MGLKFQGNKPHPRPTLQEMTFFLALFLLLGDTRTPVRPPASPSPTHTRTAAAAKPAPSDTEIEKAIREKLARSKMASENYTVRVQGGVATLEGRTEIIQRKGAATRIARTAGAREVVNKIQISDAARQKATSNLETGRRRAQVKRGDPR
jgi:BON domain-containing protein